MLLKYNGIVIIDMVTEGEGESQISHYLAFVCCCVCVSVCLCVCVCVCVSVCLSASLLLIRHAFITLRIPVTHTGGDSTFESCVITVCSLTLLASCCTEATVTGGCARTAGELGQTSR